MRCAHTRGVQQAQSRSAHVQGGAQAPANTEGIKHGTPRREGFVPSKHKCCHPHFGTGHGSYTLGVGHSGKCCTRVRCVWARVRWKHEAWQELWHADTHGCTNVLYKHRYEESHTIPCTHPPHTFLWIYFTEAYNSKQSVFFFKKKVLHHWKMHP